MTNIELIGNAHTTVHLNRFTVDQLTVAIDQHFKCVNSGFR